MNNKLYVGNLSYSTTNDQLAQHFAAAGTVVSATVIVNRYTGRSKGFGFVEMSTAEEAQKAIEMFHNKDFGGRTIVVSIARPKEPRTEEKGMEQKERQPAEQQEATQEPMEEGEAEETPSTEQPVEVFNAEENKPEEEQ